MATCRFRFVEPSRAGIRLASSSSWVRQTAVGSPRVGRCESPPREVGIELGSRRAESSDGGRGESRVEGRRPSRGPAPGRRRYAGRRSSRSSRGGWRWSAVVGPKRGAQSRVAIHAAQPKGLNGRLRLCRPVPTRRRLGPLLGVIAPLVAGERVSIGAAAALSAWPPALLELVAYLLSVLAVHFRHAAS